jgi:hypothetical protein
LVNADSETDILLANRGLRTSCYRIKLDGVEYDSSSVYWLIIKKPLLEARQAKGIASFLKPEQKELIIIIRKIDEPPPNYTNP